VPRGLALQRNDGRDREVAAAARCKTRVGCLRQHGGRSSPAMLSGSGFTRFNDLAPVEVTVVVRAGCRERFLRDQLWLGLGARLPRRGGRCRVQRNRTRAAGPARQNCSRRGSRRCGGSGRARSSCRRVQQHRCGPRRRAVPPALARAHSGWRQPVRGRMMTSLTAYRVQVRTHGMPFIDFRLSDFKFLL